MEWNGFEIFQNKEFAEIYSRHRNITLYNLQGNNAFVFKFPLIGFIKMRIYLHNCKDINEILQESLDFCTQNKIPILEIITSINADALNKYPYEPLGTYVVDLTPEIDNLWKNLGRKNRNEIRYAIKNGVVVKQAENLDDFKEWWKIYEQTSERGDFVEQQYGLVEELFKREDISRLFVAIVDNKIVAGAFLLTYKIPLFWLGGSLSEYWKYKPNNLLQWKIIEWARESNYPFYDMGGVAKSTEHGPTRFKRQFGGEYKERYKYLIDINPIKSKLIQKMIKLRYKIVKKH